MCGLAGIWHRDGRPIDVAELLALTRALRHRGPDDEGYLLADTRAGRCVAYSSADTDPACALPDIATARGSFDCGVGFRRLSVIDRSATGHQPMRSADGRHWLVFNGAIYNYRELRAELGDYPFRSAGDTEVILAAYTRWGADCFRRFNGMWAIALYDVAARRWLLSRDRFGEKPLYYTASEASLLFASEMKALACARVPDEAAVYRYLVSGRLPGPEATSFRDVRAVPPGGCLTFAAEGEPVRSRWWTLAEGSGAVSPEAAVAGYRELLEDAVRLRLRADVRGGSCLSGGVDSSSIVCLVDRLAEAGAAERFEAQTTVSAVYRESGRFNERSHIDTLLAAIRAEGNFVYPDATTLWADLAELVRHQEEPFSSTSVFAQWCVMRRAREAGLVVLLDGQGADEALGGYGPWAVHAAELLRRGRLTAAFREASGLGLFGRAAVQALPATWLAPLRSARAARAVDWQALNPDFARAHRHESEAAWADWRAQRSLSSHLRELIESSSLPHLLRYEDRNAMAFGIETRLPFLDHRLVEYAFGAAAPYRLYEGWTKWVLRRAVTGVVPEAIAWRRDKVGFETPEAVWLHHLCAERSWHDGTSRYLDPARADRTIARFRAGGPAPAALWRWLNLDAWLSVF